MEITIDIAELRKRKIIVATPMYGGQCHGFFARSCTDLQKLCTQNGINMQFLYLFNESLITRARNYCADEFLRSDGTHLLFIDSDIGFRAQDVIAMAALQSDDSPYDVICGPYPKKTIAWEKIKAAVDKGFADENPQNLAKYVGDYVFNVAEGTTTFKLNEPVEVREGGTGFMMIRRATLEKFAEAYPQQSYKPDHLRSAAFDGSREITAFFDCVIEPETRRYLSEDYMFCRWVRDIGMKVWMCPWIPLTHTGAYTFGGTLADIASIGASFTANKNDKIR